MGIISNLLKKKDSKVNKKEENIHEKRKKLAEELSKFTNEMTLEEIRRAAKMQPNMPFFQDIKNKKEFLFRDRICMLAALMASGDIEPINACKEIIECADKGLKINPKSAYLLYFKGRSKGDIVLFKEGIEILNQAAKIKPDYDDVYVERGYIKQKMGDIKGAEEDYKIAKKLDPHVTLPKTD